MTAPSNAQEAFERTMSTYVEVLDEMKPEVARELRLWNLDIERSERTVYSFSTSFDPGKKFEAIVNFNDGSPRMRFEADLSI